MSNVVINRRNWANMVKQIIDTDGVERMTRVADACNAELGASWDGDTMVAGGPESGYMVSTEGDDPLDRRDYSATVITANWPAIEDNATRQTLVNNFHLAGGG